MNQILKPELNISKEPDYINHLSKKNNINLKKNKNSNSINFLKSNHFYLFQFLISSFAAIGFLIILFIRIFHLRINESISKQLMKTYQISTLYVNQTDHSVKQLQNKSYISDSSITPFVIGMIKIDKIGLNYPILFESNKEFLNISVCRFAGPMPNEVGNLCIAGHNYVDYKFFSRLHELEKNDIIQLYDLTGQMQKYSIFKKYETRANDISCTSQDTNGETFLTLLTCNNVSGKRLVLVAKPL